MWTPMPLLGQIDALRHYVRMLRADINRASSEQSKHYRKRRVSPFVENLRYRRTRNAYEMVEVAEECLNRLRHARALSIADYFPGAQVSTHVLLPGHERPIERYVVTDVEWSKPDSYHYIVWQVTRSGQLFKRGTSWLFPSNRVRITRCSLPLPQDTERECRYFHENAQQFIDDVRDRGKLEDVFEEIRKRRERRGY